MFAFASDNDDEVREQSLLIPEFVDEEEEEKEEGAVEETEIPVAPEGKVNAFVLPKLTFQKGQDIAKEPLDVEPKDDAQTEQHEEAVVAAQNEQAVQPEALPEEPKEEVEEQHQDEQEGTYVKFLVIIKRNGFCR